MVTVFVPGEPAPQGSVKGFVVAGHAKVTHDNGKTMPWRSEIQAAIEKQAGRDAVGPLRIQFPDDEPVALDIEFIMPRRRSEPKRRTRPHTRKPDGDKLARSVADALTGVVYRDDAQVVAMSWSKRTAETGEMPGARITWGPAGPSAVPVPEARAS